MEEDMELDDVLAVVEIDFDYEFEASRFFDFTREETEEEACLAELWFLSAKTYPPSPFVANLFSMDDIFAGSVNVSPKSKCAEDEELCEPDESMRDFEGTTQTILKSMQNGNLMDDQSVPHGITSGSCRGLAFYDHFSNDTKNLKTKPAVKPHMPRSSTLMKPTASQIAKQNPRNHVKLGGSRFQKKLPNTSNAHCGVEIQASKRQKLEGGQLRKVDDLKQETNLVHKASKKVENVPDISQTRLRITIPVEPDLSTSNRAQRSRQMSTKKAENMTGRTFTFKARPLNRKILEAPTLPFSKRSIPQVPVFEVFHLKTMERAQQNTPVITSSHQTSKAIGEAVVSTKKKGEAVADPFMESVKKVGSRLKAVNSVNEDTFKSGHNFKARPLDKKIFSSKGDLGVFRNTKRAVTVPKEFDFQTEKRIQHKPLSEIFGKLSLAPPSESKISASSTLPHPSYIHSKGPKYQLSLAPQSESKISAPSTLPHPSYIRSKGPKENRGHVFHQDHSDLQKDMSLSPWWRRDQQA